MSMEIIKPGDHGQRKLIFQCTWCACVFLTDEYTIQPDWRNGSYVAATCPECGKQAVHHV